MQVALARGEPDGFALMDGDDRTAIRLYEAGAGQDIQELAAWMRMPIGDGDSLNDARG